MDFFSSLLIAISLYTVVDFFDRIGVFLDHATSAWTVIRYFIFNAPLSISRVIGFATLFSALLSLSMATRTNEITAMQASGMSDCLTAFNCIPVHMPGRFFLERIPDSRLQPPSANHLPERN